MTQENLVITFKPSQCFLEIARGAMTSIHLESPYDELVKRHGYNPLANAMLSVISITVIYSYLAIEAFTNYQLFQKWKKRHDGSDSSKRFLTLLGDLDSFQQYKDDKNSKKKFRELGDRIKTLCQITGIKKVHEENPTLWDRFIRLLRDSRHFLVHPSPEPDFFQQHLTRMFEETRAGEYVRVAEDILKYLYEKCGTPAPPWLSRNALIQFRGIDLLTEDAI